MSPLLSRLDPLLYRYAFEGRSARRYAALERCGFGDLDRRLIEALERDLTSARRFLDLGSGPGSFARALAAARPELEVVAVEPSRDYTGAREAAGGVRWIRARGEALPLGAGSVDLALCLSSIRHAADRRAVLAELRRVVAPAGACYVVELDPEAGRDRIRRHARGMRSALSRLAFGPLVVRTAPSWARIAALARETGWANSEQRFDREQPVYVLRLSGGSA